jgi:predicted outer membrane protein
MSTGQNQFNAGQNQSMPQQSAMRGERAEIDQYYAACLANKNEGEVEAGKLASERAQNPQVKQFAQMMVSDHQALQPKLQQLTGNSGSQTSERSRTTSYDSQTTTGAGVGHQPNQGTTTRETGTANQTGREAQTGREGQFGREGQTTNTPQFGQPGALTQSSTNTQVGQSANQDAIQQLIAIDRAIAEKCQENMRQKLEQKRGAEFDECYMASQVAGHAEMLSALEVLKDKTSGQLRQIVQEAEPKVKQHLQQAEQIAEQLKSSGGTRQAEVGRPGEVPRTPR